MLLIYLLGLLAASTAIHGHLSQAPLTTKSCIPYPDTETCTPSSLSCEFYNCLERKSQCGPTGYALSFGYPFCLAFTASYPGYSAKGKLWFNATKLCLQEALVPETQCETDCTTINNNAFGSHAGCYVQSGFCTLELKDYENVFKVSGNQTYTPAGVQLFSQVAEMCVALGLEGNVTGLNIGTMVAGYPWPHDF